ncbi:hypothetical protein [Mucilaginibacter sp. UR6-11]|uniref:hypothetical protein n=1 Tax=Mucilaginibacter sp. UR6-11 TaxID=1435644 RepID=UPI001E63388B|nr:hypothetical protein [Mucilaginibacter sp. UR6-11]MCC8426614.1 hypothetical protein [Mucilaginibacter sp. UR6-11]
MAKKKLQAVPIEDPTPKIQPATEPAVDPEDPFQPGDDPEIIPFKEPFEPPPYEVPPPGGRSLT